MNKMKECKCIADYSVKAMKYLGNGKHTDIYDKVIFFKDEDCYFDMDEDLYFISRDKKCLKHKNDYNTDVYDLTYEEFYKHFIKK